MATTSSCARASSEPSADGEEDERGEGEDADVEIELGEVPEEKAQHLDQVVALLADDGVGPEQAL